MFDAVQGIKFGYVLAGIIWSVALGFAAGNYACSLVHRLPRGRLLLDKKPYCGSCGAMLQVRDLFPVFSALALRHRCRYCGAPFPVSHTWTELLVGLLFALAFLEYNFGDRYLLVVCLGTFLITLAAIEANEGVIMGKILLTVAVIGIVNRTLVDGNLFLLFNGGILALLIGAALWHKRIKRVGHIYVPPPIVQLLAVGGICVGSQNLPVFFALFAVCYAALWLISHIRKGRPHVTIPFGLAVILPVLYPKLETLFIRMVMFKI